MLHDALVSHSLPGRIRLKLAGLKQDAAGLGLVAEALRRCPSVGAVESNPTVGSLLILHTGDWETLARWAEGERLFRVTQRPPTSVHERLRDGVDGVTKGLSTLAGEPVDAREWLTLGLIGLAIQQAIEGNVMVPAASLLWYAFNSARMAEMAPGGDAAAVTGTGASGGSAPAQPGRSRHAAPHNSSTAAGSHAQHEE